MVALLDEVKAHRHQIKYESLTITMSELVNMYKSEPKEIDIQPDYQRLFRWEREQQSAFIESLILEIPIPPFFLFENENGTWELLDGLQRVSTILKFIGSGKDVPDEFQGSDNDDAQWHYDTQNDIHVPLQLVGGEYLTKLQGLTYVRLPTSLQLNLKRARLHLYVLKRETHRTYKYEVFKRLNRGGSVLEDQEVRNCSVRLLNNDTAQFIEKLGRDTTFMKVVGIKKAKARNRYNEELVLRYLAMKNRAQDFRHDVTIFLDNYMEKIARQDIDFRYNEEEQLFRSTIQAIVRAFPDENPFRQKNRDGRYQGPFSPTLFEMVMIAVASNLSSYESAPPDKAKQRIEELILKAREDNLTGGGSNSKKKTLGRVRLAEGWSCE